KKPVKKAVAPQDLPLEVGDWVRIEETGSEGEILEITKSNSLIIALGSLRTVVKKNRVTKLKRKEKSKAVKRQTVMSSESIADFYAEEDCLRMFTEQAFHKVSNQIDMTQVVRSYILTH